MIGRFHATPGSQFDHSRLCTMRNFALALALGFSVALVYVLLPPATHEVPELATLKEKYSTRHTASVDHTKFPVLRKRFARPQDVTTACISCHTERHLEVMRSSHWNWERLEYIEGKGIRSVGKRNILNNFCIGITGNEQSCTRCHIGYGWSNDSSYFADASNVDCLACHDNSNTYIKAQGGKGYPDSSVQLSFVAQHVGLPMRTNCGTCHFYGGGGNNVKHGDLEQALFEPDRSIDVHMAVEGADLSCVACHTAERHQMKGKLYSVSSMNRDRSTCEQCHTAFPHRDEILNEHTLKVSCQTCHIPVYAKVNPTKIRWDWSTAGVLKNGKPFEVKDSTGVDSYMSIKGSFVWGKSLRPEYVWFDGTASHYLLGDTIPVMGPLTLNPLHGSYADPDAKIIPVKVHRAVQIYDKKFRYLIQPKTVSTSKGDGGFWREFNWQRSAEEGMKAVGLPYSGSYDFTNTEMYWPINHMVSPASEALRCNDCHVREGGRLDQLRDFYLPGRDYHPVVEHVGVGLILVTIAGVGIHAFARVGFSRRRRKEHES